MKSTQDNDDTTVFAVSVDSRGKSPSDMSCYMDHRCDATFFASHIKDNPNNVCVQSQLARLCGLDITLYFHQHSPYHHDSKPDFHIFKPMCTNVNGIATLLTFNPETGFYNHLIFGKAYVLLDNGRLPLSITQVWGLVEMITEAKTLYHKDHHHITEEAHQKLLTWTEQYKAETWAPRSLYQYRKPKAKKLTYYRFESGMSDQATCHHGGAHVHHDGHHKCCHTDDGFEDTLYSKHDEDISSDLLNHEISWEESLIPDSHHVVVQDPSRSDPPATLRCHTPAHHDRNQNQPPTLHT